MEKKNAQKTLRQMILLLEQKKDYINTTLVIVRKLKPLNLKS
jgi:hypothetical protein